MIQSTLYLIYLRYFSSQNLEKILLNKNIISLRSVISLSILVFIISSCNPTKYVPQNESLLDEFYVTVNKEGVKKADLIPYIKQKPNKKIFGVKFHLGLYNLSNIKKEKWPHSWLRNIGEEPVIFDQYSTDKSVNDIHSYIASKGYFDSQVVDTVETANRKSKVSYKVDLKPPYIIRNIYFQFADSTIGKFFYFDSVNCLIERGKPYDVDVLQSERSRFERFIRDRGFYSFSGDHIYFNVDSTPGNRQVDIYYGVRNAMKFEEGGKVTHVPHSISRIRNIYIFPDFVPRDVLEGGEEYRQRFDTTLVDGYYFITPNDRPLIKPDLIVQSLYLKPGSLYNVTNTEQSQSHLMALKTFRLVNIFYDELSDPEGEDDGTAWLDCTIQLSLLSQQSFRVEVEGTNSAGNLGGALNLIYQHKNLFRGAELFDLKLKGAYEALSQQDTIRSVQEYGIETSLRFPKFLLPFIKTEDFIKKYNPSTTLLAAYNYQNMPFYTRTMVNASFGYTWNGNSYTTHIVSPVQFNLVNLLRIDPDFEERILSSSYLAYSYRDVMILGGSYSFIFNTQKIQKTNDYWFVRLNAETSGNLLGLIGKLADIKKTDGLYNILGQSFAQYVRADVDIRYNVVLNDVSSIVYRAFVGAGIPYGNSRAIPFEKQYFGGGANGIRAWQVRTLGPGSYVPDKSKFLNQTADIKIEANTEYRFKLFWILHGAVFLDAGNIWSFNNDTARPGSQFSLKNFYRDLAVGTGTGLRFDLSFVTMRLDMGIKLRDPWITSGSKWIPLSRKYVFKNDFAFVVAIGYPF